jgi:hypothetical protein
MPNMDCIWGLSIGILCLLFAANSMQALNLARSFSVDNVGFFSAWTYHLPEFNPQGLFTAESRVTATIWEISCMFQPQCTGDAIRCR